MRNKIDKQIRRNYMQSPARLLNQIDAFHKGKNVVLTLGGKRINAKEVFKPAVWDKGK